MKRNPPLSQSKQTEATPPPQTRFVASVESFQTNIGSLLNDVTFSDITLVIKGDYDETTRIHAHRAILGSRSAVFERV